MIKEIQWLDGLLLVQVETEEGQRKTFMVNDVPCLLNSADIERFFC